MAILWREVSIGRKVIQIRPRRYSEKRLKSTLEILTPVEISPNLALNEGESDLAREILEDAWRSIILGIGIR